MGSLATALIAWGNQFLRARGEIKAHDLFVAERDEDLATWVSDRSLFLWREKQATTNEMNERNFFYSSAHGLALSLLKERALHEYRDQERQARRDVAVAEQSETRMHRLWRKGPLPQLRTPSRAERVLDDWRAPVKDHGSPAIRVVDIAKDLDSALFELGEGGEGTVFPDRTP